MTPTLSIVVPVYCNQETLEPLLAEIRRTFDGELPAGDFEVVFVDDGSLDDSLAVLRRMHAASPGFVRVVRLSRNFGSHSAILAGLAACRGRYAAVIGADLQEHPSIVLRMLTQAREDRAEVVLACREARDEAASKVAFANFYYWLMRRFSQARFPPGGFDCYLVARPVIDALVRLGESNTSIAALILWMGFRQSCIYYTKAARLAGKSRWTLRKKIRLVLDSMISFSHVPIRAMEFAGCLAACAGLAYAAYIVWLHAIGGTSVAGWSSLMVVVLISSGLVLIALGVIGEYLWRVLDAARRRPVFLVAETWDVAGTESLPPEDPPCRNPSSR